MIGSVGAAENANATTTPATAVTTASQALNEINAAGQAADNI